ncbi:MAG: hypothetical protein NVS4B8_27680 [Herpetosiphon sp.]
MGEYFNSQWLRWGQSLVTAIPRLLQSLVVVALVLFFAGRLQGGVERIVGRRGQRELARLLGRLVRLGVLMLGLVFVLAIFQQTGIVASFIASLGIFGLVVAFALQDITKNFAAGVLLLVQRPFGLDDRIKVGLHEGIVTDINLRAMSLRTNDGHEVLIPNTEVYAGPITNLSRYAVRRITIPFSLPRMVEAEAALPRLEAALKDSGVVDRTIAVEHPPLVVLTGLGKDEVTGQAMFWIAAHTDPLPLTSAATVALQQTVRELQPPAVAVVPR